MKKNNIALTALAALVVAGCSGEKDGVDFNTPTFNPTGLHYSYPLDGQERVSPKAPIVLAFNTQVEATADNFTLTGPEGTVALTLEAVNNGKGLVLTPQQPLEKISEYSLEMQGVMSNDGEIVFPDGALNFTTRTAFHGPVNPQTEPGAFRVVSTFPDGDQFPMVDMASFRLRTSAPVDVVSATYGGTVSLEANGEVVPASLLVDGNAITVDPKEDLQPGVDYQLTVDGLSSRFGATIEPFSQSFTVKDTTPRAVLVTKAPPADDTLGCLDDGVRLSPLTGMPINCVPVRGTILADQTSSKQSGDLYAELAFTPNFPEVTPLRVPKGSILTGDALAVLVGGQVQVGFDSGDVTVTQLSDATGYLFPNPNSNALDAPKNLRLMMDIAVATTDARANGAFTQKIMQVELIGQGLIDEGQLNADAIAVVEPAVLGVEDTFGLLSFRMESYLDQETAPMQSIDTEAPRLLTMVDENGEQQLSWQPGTTPDRVEPGDPIVLNFNEPLDQDTIVAGETLKLRKDGVATPFTWVLDGDSLIIRPEGGLEYSASYEIETTPAITDLAGREEKLPAIPGAEPNPLITLDTLQGDNVLDFTMPAYSTDAPRAPFATVVYPGFPCATTEATASDISNGTQGHCLSTYPEDEQNVVDELPIVAMPADRGIRVRFSQDMAAASLESGILVEQLNEDGSVAGTVEGVVETEPRGLTFLPNDPWEEGVLYRYTLLSNEGTGCTGICSESGLPLQTALLNGAPAEEGGPSMKVLFRGALPNDTVFQELGNLATVDVNANFQVDAGEPATTVVAEDPVPPTPDNASSIFPRGDGGTGLVSRANTGCGFEGSLLGSGDPLECFADKTIYVHGDLNTNLRKVGAVEFNDGQVIEGVQVDILPTMVSLTSLRAVAEVASLTTITTDTGPQFMRVRYAEDGEGNRNQPVTGVIFQDPDCTGDNCTAKFRITFDLLFDAPYLALDLGLDHNVKGLEIPNVTVQGDVKFLPDGRLFLSLVNEQPLNVDLNISSADLGAGQVTLVIPEGAINLSYQSVSIK